MKWLENKLIRFVNDVFAHVDLTKDGIPDKEQFVPLIQRFVAAVSPCLSAVKVEVAMAAIGKITAGFQELAGAVDQEKLKEASGELIAAGKELAELGAKLLPPAAVEALEKVE